MMLIMGGVLAAAGLSGRAAGGLLADGSRVP